MILHAPTSQKPPLSAWQTWTGAPHRMMFLPGAVLFVLTILLVAWEVGGRSLGLWGAPPWAVPPAWGHAYLMLFGLFPWFIFGFGMTAMPNWTGQKVARAAWIAAALLMIAGVLLLLAGLVAGAALAVAGGALQLAGWLIGTGALARLVLAQHRAAKKRDRHATAIVGLLLLGACAAALFLAGIAAQEAGWIALAGTAGIWLFLLPIFLVVSHRLIPFFSSRVIAQYLPYDPAVSLPLLGLLCLAHFALEGAGLAQYTWVADFPLAAWTGWLAHRWGLAKSFRARLLAMLHVSLAVLSASLALHAAASLAALAGEPALFGRGPLHLLAIGYFAAMTMGMVSRVSLGHSGRALEADAITWYGFLALVATGVLRAVADFAPLAGPARAWLLGISAAGWIVVMGAWALRFVPIYLAPRPDGKPG